MLIFMLVDITEYNITDINVFFENFCKYINLKSFTYVEEY